MNIWNYRVLLLRPLSLSFIGEGCDYCHSNDYWNNAALRNIWLLFRCATEEIWRYICGIFQILNIYRRNQLVLVKKVSFWILEDFYWTRLRVNLKIVSKVADELLIQSKELKASFLNEDDMLLRYFHGQPTALTPFIVLQNQNLSRL